MRERHAILIVGLAYGDCGKGTIVDFLVRKRGSHTVVRYNGGPQAGHNVVTRDGRHHTFSQFGSGTLVAGVRTLLSRFMLIEPYALFNEAAHFEDLGVLGAWDRLLIDARCPVITPAHQAANRLREIARGETAHGTCGLGVGEARLDLMEHPHLMLHASLLRDRAAVAKKLRAIRDLKIDQLREEIAAAHAHPWAQSSIHTLLDPSWIEVAVDVYAELSRRATIIDEQAGHAVLRAPGTVIYEGAQGALLDEVHGFHPHTTWSDTTLAGAEALLDEARHDGPRTRIGVIRSYFTRHGFGPLVTEDDALGSVLPEPHNDGAGWQGRFRVGLFDAVAARYARAAVGPLDTLAVTHLDRFPRLAPRVCQAYQPFGPVGAWPAPAGFQRPSRDLERPGGRSLMDESRSAPIVSSSGSEAARDGFVWNGPWITDIQPLRPVEAARMERLTERLRQCRPVYATLPVPGVAGFLDFLQAELRLPVSITSFGPTADDKRMNLFPKE